MNKIKLSVVVPCYNEHRRFAEGLSHYYSFLKKQNYSWELIFVNDGSSDDTSELIRAAQKKNPNIKIVDYRNNRGKGYAISQGIKKAQGQYILFTDLDHSVDIKTINEFFKYFENGDQVVIGSRRVKGAKLAVRQKPFREFLGRGFTLLVNILIMSGIKDCTCGFKAFENKAAKEIFNKVSIFDWAFDAEIIFICKKKGIHFAQAPVTWKDASGSKVRLKKDVIYSFLGLLKIRLNDLKGRYR
ncbi:glycosyltransferase family 2 protein [Candidatus Curtissbacteria bacterium]|nr:glycosyltransferase family 2 protein [Candidatus Curtissbacteria bacterium]